MKTDGSHGVQPTRSVEMEGLRRLLSGPAIVHPFPRHVIPDDRVGSIFCLEILLPFLSAGVVFGRPRVAIFGDRR